MEELDAGHAGVGVSVQRTPGSQDDPFKGYDAEGETSEAMHHAKISS
jgi:hypothetical protein